MLGTIWTSFIVPQLCLAFVVCDSAPVCVCELPLN